MVGYINEFGFLVAKEQGDMKVFDASVWKPVDNIDESKRQCDEGYYVKLIPYDAGNHIAFNYVKQKDKQYYNKQIAELKKQLEDTDYQVTKCYESFLMNEALPYDVAALHQFRQAARDKINELEEEFANA